MGHPDLSHRSGSDARSGFLPNDHLLLNDVAADVWVAATGYRALWGTWVQGVVATPSSICEVQRCQVGQGFRDRSGESFGG